MSKEYSFLDENIKTRRLLEIIVTLGFLFCLYGTIYKFGYSNVFTLDYWTKLESYLYLIPRLIFVLFAAGIITTAIIFLPIRILMELLYVWLSRFVSKEKVDTAIVIIVTPLAGVYLYILFLRYYLV